MKCVTPCCVKALHFPFGVRIYATFALRTNASTNQDGCAEHLCAADKLVFCISQHQMRCKLYHIRPKPTGTLQLYSCVLEGVHPKPHGFLGNHDENFSLSRVLDANSRRGQCDDF